MEPEKRYKIRIQIEEPAIPKVEPGLVNTVCEEVKGNKDYAKQLAGIIKLVDPAAASSIESYLVSSPDGHKLATAPAMVYRIVRQATNIRSISYDAFDDVGKEFNEAPDTYLNDVAEQMRIDNPAILDALGSVTWRFTRSILAAQAGVLMYRVLERQAELDSK